MNRIDYLHLLAANLRDHDERIRFIESMKAILITHELLLHTKPQIVRQNISKVFIVLGMHNFV